MSERPKPARNWRTRHIDRPLGAKIAELRTLAGLTRRQLARCLGVSESQVQHGEEGDNRFSASQVWQICRVLSVSVSDVFSGLPTHIVGRQDVARPTDPAASGVREDGAEWIDSGQVRPDIVALSKAARRLTPQQVESFTEMLKSMKPKR